MVTKTWGYLEVLGSSDLNTTFAECATLTGTENLTNKTLTSPTITNKTSTGTDSGTETLSNKTLTSPTINTASIGSVSGGTPAANKFYTEAIPKAWGKILANGTIDNSYNIDSVTKAGTTFIVNLKRAFNSTDYIIVGSCGDPNVLQKCNIQFKIESTSQFKAYINYYDGTYVSMNFSFIAIGAQ